MLFAERESDHLMRRSNLNFNTPLPPTFKPRAFELLKIGSFKFPPPRVKIVFKYPILSSHFVCKRPLLKTIVVGSYRLY